MKIIKSRALISTLNDKRYKVIKRIPVNLYISEETGKILVIHHCLGIFGEGETYARAMLDMKEQLVHYAEFLETTDKDSLFYEIQRQLFYSYIKEVI